jgi:regulator of protease activity HflC (stomatin/prohibitin superfamily)
VISWRQARATLQAESIEAEAREVKARAEANAIILKAEAEAKAIEEIGAAEAEAKILLMDALAYTPGPEYVPRALSVVCCVDMLLCCVYCVCVV